MGGYRASPTRRAVTVSNEAAALGLASKDIGRAGLFLLATRGWHAGPLPVAPAHNVVERPAVRSGDRRQRPVGGIAQNRVFAAMLRCSTEGTSSTPSATSAQLESSDQAKDADSCRLPVNMTAQSCQRFDWHRYAVMALLERHIG